MASKEAIAIMTEKALDRITDVALQAHAANFCPPPDLDGTGGRDPFYNAAVRIERLADWVVDLWAAATRRVAELSDELHEFESRLEDMKNTPSPPPLKTEKVTMNITVAGAGKPVARKPVKSTRRR